MPLYDFTEFLKLSSVLNYNLSAASLNRYNILYQNKSLMIEASIAFVVIFLHFLNDAKYYVQGISAEGIEPK